MHRRSVSRGLVLFEVVCYLMIVSSMMFIISPKITLLTEMATTTKLNGAKAAIQAHLELIYTQAVLEQKHQGWAKILYQNQWLDLNNGYPTLVGQIQPGQTASLPLILDNLEMTYKVLNQAIVIEITEQCSLSVGQGEPSLSYRFTAIGCP